MIINVYDFEKDKFLKQKFNYNNHKLIFKNYEYIWAKNVPDTYVLENGVYLEKPTGEIRLKNFPYIYPYNYTYSSCEFIDIALKEMNSIPKGNNSGDNLKYTFGLEFETSSGYIQMHECLGNGIIPLRDGSITGIEYVTVPLSGNKGVAQLKNIINLLDKNTSYNKECALHIHFGGYPVQSNKIFALYKLLSIIQYEMNNLFGWHWAFNTDNYKSNHKNYCSDLPYFSSFNEMYKYLVGRPYFGDLYQPHPYDLHHESKWNIKSRYYMCNFINMLCFDKAKTIEFRFLRPTYHWGVIQFWLYYFNNILQFADIYSDDIIKCDYRNIKATSLAWDLADNIPNRQEMNSVASLRREIKDYFGYVDKINDLYINKDTF